jgi:hypothetical protein
VRQGCRETGVQRDSVVERQREEDTEIGREREMQTDRQNGTEKESKKNRYTHTLKHK